MTVPPARSPPRGLAISSREQLADFRHRVRFADDGDPEAGLGEGIGHRVQRPVPEAHLDGVAAHGPFLGPVAASRAEVSGTDGMRSMLAGPAADDAPPAGLVTPDGTWAARCAAGGSGLAVADVTTSTDSPARAWRRTARTTLRD
jgi:hypothetical protein